MVYQSIPENLSALSILVSKLGAKEPETARKLTAQKGQKYERFPIVQTA